MMRTRSSRRFGEPSGAFEPNSGNISYRLPPELLSTIFVFYKQDVISESRSSRNTLPAIPWLPPSHASSYWRYVALSCPKFWNFIPLNNIDACKALLQRSKHAPLHVTKRGATRHASGKIKTILMRCLEMVMAQSHRVQTLDLGALHAVSWKHRPPYFVKAFEKFHFMALESLIVDSFCISDTHLLVDWLGPFLQNVIQSQIGKLDRLVLIGCPSRYWDSLSSSSLTKLEVVVLESVPLDTIFRVLTNLPNLERFSLDVHDGGWPPDDTTGTPLYPPISLPFLRDLQLNTSSSMTCTILQVLNIPPSTDIHIERLGLDLEPGVGYAGLKAVVEQLQPFLSAHESSTCEPAASPFRSMFLTCMPWSLRVGLNRTTEPLDYRPASSTRATAQLKNSIDLVCANSTTADGLSAITEHLSPALSHLEVMVIRLDRDEPTRPTFYEFFERPWLEFAARLPNLHTLEISMSRYSQPLVLRSLSVSSDSVPPRPFPNLRNLILEGLHFEAIEKDRETRPAPRPLFAYDFDWDSDGDGFEYNGVQETVEVQSNLVLHNVLDGRNRAGIPIGSLELRKVRGIDQTFVDNKLDGLAQNISWDAMVDIHWDHNPSFRFSFTEEFFSNMM